MARKNPLRFKSEKEFEAWRAKTGAAPRPRKPRGKKKRGRGLGRAIIRGLSMMHNKQREAKPMTEQTAKQKRARSKNRNHPSPKQIAARKKFAAMSKRRAREARAAKRGTVTRAKNKQPGASRKSRGKNKACVTRPAKKSGARSNITKRLAPKKPSVPSRANSKARRRNSAVNEVFRTFVGRDSHSIAAVDFPNSAPANLAQLGKLTQLKSETETFQFAESEGVYLASDARGNLYVGGKQQPVEPNTNFGKLLGVSYVCKKSHIEPGKTIEYVHKFGDEGGKCPRLRSDAEGRFIITGGTYTITSAGIAD